MRRHARCHERRGAVPVDGYSRDVEAGQDRHDTADVVTLLAPRQAAAADQVLYLAAIELWDLIEDLGHHVGGQVVGPDVDEGSFACPTDRRTTQSHDHCISHGLNIVRSRTRLLRGALSEQDEGPEARVEKGDQAEGR